MGGGGFIRNQVDFTKAINNNGKMDNPQNFSQAIDCDQYYKTFCQ